MVNKLNREGYPSLFAEMAMVNGTVKGLFEEFQSNPKVDVGGNSDSRQVRVSIALVIHSLDPSLSALLMKSHVGWVERSNTNACQRKKENPTYKKSSCG